MSNDYKNSILSSNDDDDKALLALDQSDSSVTSSSVTSQLARALLEDEDHQSDDILDLSVPMVMQYDRSLSPNAERKRLPDKLPMPMYSGPVAHADAITSLLPSQRDALFEDLQSDATAVTPPPPLSKSFDSSVATESTRSSRSPSPALTEEEEDNDEALPSMPRNENETPQEDVSPLDASSNVQSRKKKISENSSASTRRSSFLKRAQQARKSGRKMQPTPMISDSPVPESPKTATSESSTTEDEQEFMASEDESSVNDDVSTLSGQSTDDDEDDDVDECPRRRRRKRHEDDDNRSVSSRFSVVSSASKRSLKRMGKSIKRSFRKKKRRSGWFHKRSKRSDDVTESHRSRKSFGWRSRRNKKTPDAHPQQQEEDIDLFEFICQSLVDLADDVAVGTTYLCSGCGEDNTTTTNSNDNKNKNQI